MKMNNYKFRISAIFLFMVFTAALLFNFSDAGAAIEELNRALDSNAIQNSAAAGSESSSAAAVSAENSGVVMGSYLNVRTAPWGDIIGRLKHGQKINIIAREGDWYKIKYNGRDAYIHHKYAQKTKPARVAATPEQSTPKASAAPAAAVAPKSSAAGLSAPLGGSFKVGSRYGMRFHPILKVNRMHNGVDIGKPTGTPLLAMGDGKVIYSGWCNGGGYMVKIKYDNGYTSTYMHCLPSGAKPVGAKVTAGQQVAKVNNTGLSTGSHLHLEIWNPSGQRIDPMKVL